MQGIAKTLDLTAAFYGEGHDPFCPASEVVHFCIEERTSEFKSRTLLYRSHTL